jgi:hypothetical protein
MVLAFLMPANCLEILEQNRQGASKPHVLRVPACSSQSWLKFLKND